LVDAIREGGADDTLILVEHDPVYTLGRGGEDKNILMPEKEREEKGIELYRTGRGGDVTYHGPGQIVAYPIMDIRVAGRGVLWFVDGLEETVVRTLDAFGIKASTERQNRGVWVGNDKIAAIGVRVIRRVTMHGFSLNVRVNLEHYDGIVACGLRGKGITSMHLLLPDVDMSAVRQRLAQEFTTVFGYDGMLVDGSENDEPGT
jgi:lipoate-protein ligase B